ncbi:MAG: 1-deoxy-D-xylulose-5-phosphate reductoisomerase [Syntrophaceae bacterium]|nr:1-deoxy-D-xylulose-5-phosphate reductoisomerase [Syntrophaceae bacterium]
MKKVAILGSTGSIGCSALDIIEKNPERFQIVALAAGKNIKLLKEQIEKFQPKQVAVSSKDNVYKLRETLTAKSKVKIFHGEEGIKKIASYSSADIVVSAISGAAGLLPTLAAIEAGKDVALANKETLVLAGEIVTKRAVKKGVKIIPVDSEHSAIFQCLEGKKKENLRRIILTASGGPFLDFTKSELKKVSLSQTLRHPRWKMGKKVTIDSASLMNKGLEMIEAKWLFNLDFSAIDVMVHPQSIVHSMVEFNDGAFLAQIGVPDMKIPIAYALTYPERIVNDVTPLNLLKVQKLEFYKPDIKKFPCLNIARDAGICGGTAPAVLNAADEVAVNAFIQKKICFADLAKIIEKVLNVHDVVCNPSLNDILQADSWARTETEKIIERMVR